MVASHRGLLLFFFKDTATTEIYTLSLHDALPIRVRRSRATTPGGRPHRRSSAPACSDRKSTRLNSSHSQNSYAVFCLTNKTTAIVMPALYAIIRLLAPPRFNGATL